MNFEQVTPKISLAALRALNEFNNKHGIHIIYNAERTVNNKEEKTGIKPFPGYNIQHLVRFVKPQKRYALGAGGKIEVGFRDIRDNSFYIHHCITGYWAESDIKLFKPRHAPALQEAIWIGLSLESGNVLKGYQNGLEFGRYDGLDWSVANDTLYFHNDKYNTCKVMQIHLFANDATKLFLNRSWGDCDAYHLYCGSVVTIKCRYTYNTSSYKGLSFAIGNVSGATAVVNFPAYANTGESYVVQIFVGETVYNIVSKNKSKVIHSMSFKNTKTRTYLDFASHNIVLDNVFMETSGSPWK
ncbi:uncharacterized protein [Dermacentor andersoni]|uniref:uncharacterized protein isoform X1 n=1 Tax=Dermacentor andersoni TaxID=34620 RepID=UPI003B3B10CA